VKASAPKMEPDVRTVTLSEGERDAGGMAGQKGGGGDRGERKGLEAALEERDAGGG